MAHPIGALRAELSAGHASFGRDMGKARDHVQRNAKGMQTAMGKVKRSFDNTIKSIGMMAGAYVGFYAGVRAIKSIITEAANYETALVNMAKVTDQSFEEIDKTIKGIAPEIGNYTELMKGYYQVISAGVTNPKKALDMLTAASKLAKVAGVEQGETVKALTKLMTGYAGEIETAADASDLLLTIEKKGQTQVSELVPIIGEVATVSRMAGLSAEEMGGALSVLTQTAGSTAEASTLLGAALTSVLKPTPEMTKAFEKYGGALNAIKKIGYVEWLKAVQKETGGVQERLVKMLGGRKEASIAVASLVSNLDGLSESITEMTDRTGKMGDAWTAYEKTSNAALDKFRNNIHNIEITLGTALLPALNGVAGETGEWIKQNEKLIGQKFDEYVGAIGTALKALVSAYNSMPAGAIDAGIVGLILAGKYGPLKLAIALVAINNAMHNIGNSFGDMRGTSDALAGNVKNILDVLTGKRDWNTGKLKDGLKGVTREAENTNRVILDISKSIKALYSKSGDGGGGGETVNPNEEAIQKQIKALELQRDTFGMATKEVALYHLKMQGATEEQLKQATVILDAIGVKEADADAQKKMNDLIDEGKSLTKSLMTGTEQYAATVGNLDVLLKAGAITQETYNRGIEKAKDDLEGLANTGKDAFDKLKTAIEGWGRDSADAIVRFARTGEMTFQGMIDSMIDDLLRMMIYQQITGPLFSGFGSMIAGKGFGAGVAAFQGSAHGNVFQNGNVIPFASGGIVTRPTVFPMAQGAGLMGEAGAEAIMPLTRIGGDLGVKSTGGGVEVNIINNVGADVSTSERTTADGQKAIDVYIDQAVAKKLGTFGSQSNKAMRQSFGARQQLTGR